MGDFRKNILQTDFERKKKSLAKKIPALPWLCMPGKKLYHQKFGGEKFLHKPNHPYSPSKVKRSAPNVYFIIQHDKCKHIYHNEN